MAKRGEIPADKSADRTYRNAASLAQVGIVRARVESLGWGWHDAVADAGVSRNVGYTLLRGQGSIGSLRTIEAWASGKETEVKKDREIAPKELWAALGEELRELDLDQFEATIEAVQEYVSAEKRRRAAFSKLLRVNPEPRR